MLYREGFVFNHMGYAAAIAWLLFVVVLVLNAGAVLVRSPPRLLRRGRAMTAVAKPRTRSIADRGPVAKQYRRFLGRSAILMFALLIIGAYLLPLLYMVTTAFQQPGQSTTPGAPVWPAAP